MLFTPTEQPESFLEALLSRDVRKIMPTHLGSAELQRLGTAVLERSMFSAKTLDENLLQGYAERIRKMLNPVTEANGVDGALRTDGLDLATARLEIKGILSEIGYAPEPGKEGTLQDLASDKRINLVLKTNVEMAQGYGYWAQGQDPEVLDAYPCSELFRAEARDEERPWAQDNGIWIQAAREVGDHGAIRCWAEHNRRMVARKDSPIWVAISDFGQPYPPFKFNSGMDVMDVDRIEAVELGVIEENAIVLPQSRGFELN